MLNLDARVDLHEVELVVGEVEEEFHRAGIRVVDALRRLDGKAADLAAHLFRQGDGRRLFEELLIAALQRAFALAEEEHRAVIVGEDLRLDVARMLDIVFEVVDDFLEIDEMQDVLEILFGMCDEHALAAAA